MTSTTTTNATTPNSVSESESVPKNKTPTEPTTLNNEKDAFIEQKEEKNLSDSESKDELPSEEGSDDHSECKGELEEGSDDDSEDDDETSDDNNEDDSEPDDGYEKEPKFGYMARAPIVKTIHGPKRPPPPRPHGGR